MKTIKILCQGAISLDLAEMFFFQGNLKDLSKENYKRLRDKIVNEGFAEPIAVWKDPEEGVWRIIGGHQRWRVLKELRYAEKFDIPLIPCSIVLADSVREAKLKILGLASQFGELTKEGLYEFMVENNITIQEVKEFNFPEVNMELFEEEFFGMEEEEMPEEEEEIGSDAIHCPQCGHEFVPDSEAEE